MWLTLTDSSVGQGEADDIQGTENDDTITGATGTLESIDVINGKGGNDTLTARIDDPGSNGTIAPVITAVETLDFLTRGNSAFTFSFADVSGQKDVSVTGTTGTNTVTFDVLPNDFEMTVKNVDDESFAFSQAADSDSDAITLNLDGVTNNDDTFLASGSDYETVTFNSTGDDANAFNFEFSNLDGDEGTVEVTGKQDLNIVLNDNGSIGDLTEVNIKAGDHDGDLTLTLEGTGTLDLENATGVTTIAVDGANFAANAVASVENAEDDTSLSLEVDDDPAADNEVNVNYDQDGAESLSSASDSLTVDLNIDDDEDDFDADVNVTTNEIESQTINVTATDDSSTLTYTVDDSAVENLSWAGEGATTLESITVDGDGINGGALETFSAADATANITVGNNSNPFFSSNSTGTEFQFGSGDDTLDANGATNAVIVEAGDGDDTVIGGNAADEIELGAGADDVTGGGGADTIDLGEDDGDADTVIYTAASESDASTTDDISNFVGGEDEIQFTNAATFEDVGTQTGANLGTAVGNAFSAAAGANDGGIEALQFQFDGSTYFTVEAGATDDDTGALVVEVVGLTGTVAADDFVA